VAFASDLQSNLEALRRSVAEQHWRPGPFRTFSITDPKPRIISAAPFPDRIVHHALIHVAGPIFERSLIHHTYACRIGKGTHAAVLHAFDRCKASPWYLKLDVRKYFDSIDHEILSGLIGSLFRERPLLEICKRIVGSYSTAPGRGVPIGNLTSQHFANSYLSAFDHLVLERLRPAGYVRYMDDMVLWGAQKEELSGWAEEARSWLDANRGLTLKHVLIGRSAKGLPFLGHRITTAGIYLSGRGKRRFRKKYRAMDSALVNGLISENEASHRIGSLTAATALARSRSFRHAVINGAVLRQ